MMGRACESCWFAAFRQVRGRERLVCLVTRVVVGEADLCDAWMLERPHNPDSMDLRRAGAVLP